MEPETVTILLIEDNPADARVLAEALRDADPSLIRPQLLVEGTLQAGRRRLEAGGIDVALLDLSLPDSSGLPTFEAAHAAAPEVPILLLCGLADEPLALAAVQAGAQDYLVKGHFDGNGLSRAVRCAIERKRSLLAHQALMLQQSRLEGVLLAAREMAHRINNEIQLAVGSLSLLEEHDSLSPDFRELVSDALARILGVANHVQHLQSVIRVEVRRTPAGPSLDLMRSTDHLPNRSSS